MPAPAACCLAPARRPGRRACCSAQVNKGGTSARSFDWVHTNIAICTRVAAARTVSCGSTFPGLPTARDGRSTPTNGRAGDAAGTEEMCQKETCRQAASLSRAAVGNCIGATLPDAAAYDDCARRSPEYQALRSFGNKMQACDRNHNGSTTVEQSSSHGDGMVPPVWARRVS
jgi:hypothetical protein